MTWEEVTAVSTLALLGGIGETREAQATRTRRGASARSVALAGL